ncbi:MAG TPA: type II toxin-antitoxin system RelE/ParE family toxin [Mucilaginibacter sp.]|jgi:plasmid stabilization system protein ParE
MDKQTHATATTYQIRLSENAIQNIDEITGYIAFINHQPLNAIKVGDAFFEAIGKIEQNPYASKECGLIPTKSKMYRQKICLSWYIVYKIVAPQVIVLGIIHISRKPSKIKALRKIK